MIISTTQILIAMIIYMSAVIAIGIIFAKQAKKGVTIPEGVAKPRYYQYVI